MPAVYNYDPNIPFANNAPRDDQPVMQQNAASIQGIISVDHENFGSTTNGYHTVIHQRTGAGTQNLTRSGAGATYTNVPANIPGVNQVISGLYTPDATGATPDTQLFNLTGNGGISQITGNTTSGDGWAWSGGILIQWGSITGLSTTWPTNDQTLIFKDRSVGAIPFPNNCFIVLTTFIGPTSTSTGDIVINSKSASNFHWQFTGSSTASFGGFYWVAIGN